MMNWKLICAMLPVAFAVGCVATAPVTVAWRSNTSQQHATTDGRTVKDRDANTVNADRMAETQAAVATGGAKAHATGGARRSETGEDTIQ